MKNKSMKIKISVLIALVVAFLIIIFLIYKNLFAASNNSRYKNIDKYELTDKEISSVTTKVKELGNIESVDVYVKSKTIVIFVKLTEDIDFEVAKATSNELLSNFSENNLSYYDVQIFFDSKNEESTVYPQIGYKHKTKTEFSW